MIHDFNWYGKQHTTIAAWRTWKKAMRILCDEIKDKMRILLGKWRLENNKYMKSWKLLLSHDLHTLYYREHGTR